MDVKMAALFNVSYASYAILDLEIVPDYNGAKTLYRGWVELYCRGGDVAKRVINVPNRYGISYKAE